LEADKNNWLHVAGCMLYWAEGSKRNNRNAVAFTNSDLEMMRLFLLFLRKCFGVKDSDITLHINCYTDIKDIVEIEKFWIEGLGLTSSCLRKSIVNRRPQCSQNKRKGILPNGTCKMVVNDVSIMQRIFGSMQEYGGFVREEW
jgi:uncharacterized protein YegJ (DUF2314 family)